MAKVGNVTREEIASKLRELEAQYDMPTSDFELALHDGLLHETPEFRQWAHLAAALRLFDRRPISV